MLVFGSCFFYTPKDNMSTCVCVDGQFPKTNLVSHSLPKDRPPSSMGKHDGYKGSDESCTPGNRPPETQLVSMLEMTETKFFSLETQSWWLPWSWEGELKSPECWPRVHLLLLHAAPPPPRPNKQVCKGSHLTGLECLPFLVCGYFLAWSCTAGNRKKERSSPNTVVQICNWNVGVRWSRDRGQKIAQARIGKVKKGSVHAVFE